MRVDASGECKTILGVENVLRALRLNFRCQLGDLPVFDRNIETIDGGLVRADDAGILDHNVERFVHGQRSLTTHCRPAAMPLRSACRARAYPACRSTC